MKNHLTLPGIDISGHIVLYLVWVTAVGGAGAGGEEGCEVRTWFIFRHVIVLDYTVLYSR